MYQDFRLEKSTSGVTEEVYDVDAIIEAVKIILLSEPGNFPFHPDLGLNIGKYLFHYLDQDTISDIQTELNYQMARYLPAVSSLTIKVEEITDNNGNAGLGIIIQSYVNNTAYTATIAVVTDENTIHIINETY